MLRLNCSFDERMIRMGFRGILAILAFFCLTGHALANTYHVSTSGKDSNDGSSSAPWASLNKANGMVKAGDTVWIHGGTYLISDTTYVKNDAIAAGILLRASGSSDDNRIHYLAFPGEHPVFDFSKMPISTAYDKADGTNTLYSHGLVIQAKYLHLKGLEIRNVPMANNSNVGVYISRSTHIFLEQINSHHNNGAGFFVTERGTGSGGGHYFLNCDSHDNYDPNGRQGDGENADGFGVHYQQPGVGDTTKFFGCRAWWNSDDGWDFIGQNYPVVVENSYAMGNGYASYGTLHPKNANGNGFKAGSDATGTAHHVISRCVAWNNYTAGFYANHSAAGNKWYNNTSYNNKGSQYNMWASSFDEKGTITANGIVLTGDNAHDMKNNIAYPNKVMYIGSYNGVQYASGSYNTWNLDITPKETDFVSLDDPSVSTTGKDLSSIPGMLGPRQADGSLPETDFLKLKASSQMIDKGIKLGLPYSGSAPDLGAYEYGLPFGGISSSSESLPDLQTSSSAESSTSQEVMTSTSSPEGASSSSQEHTAALHLWQHEKKASLEVFDLQGRYLGQLNSTALSDEMSLAELLYDRFCQSGIYLIRQGANWRKVRVR